jgi:hypothetical protein
MSKFGSIYPPMLRAKGYRLSGYLRRSHAIERQRLQGHGQQTGCDAAVCSGVAGTPIISLSHPNDGLVQRRRRSPIGQPRRPSVA